jgi:drug/metabolite transporter (DMT)-like permease
LILLAVSAVGVFSVLFFYAFRTIGAMRTGAVLPTSALWGILVALLLFPNETLSGIQILGGALMVGALAVFYILRGPSKVEAAGETLKPEASDGPDSP